MFKMPVHSSCHCQFNILCVLSQLGIGEKSVALDVRRLPSIDDRKKARAKADITGKAFATLERVFSRIVTGVLKMLLPAWHVPKQMIHIPIVNATEDIDDEAQLKDLPLEYVQEVLAKVGGKSSKAKMKRIMFQAKVDATEMKDEVVRLAVETEYSLYNVSHLAWLVKRGPATSCKWKDLEDICAMKSLVLKRDVSEMYKEYAENHKIRFPDLPHMKESFFYSDQMLRLQLLFQRSTVFSFLSYTYTLHVQKELSISMSLRKWDMTEEDGPRRVTRYSVRPPSRFVGKGADFRLWIQRVELYFREADVPRDKRGQELASLLDDEPFRIVSQMGLLRVDSGIDYPAVKECLEKQFAPSELQLEWQRKFHTGQQEQAESLIAFSARLRMLLKLLQQNLDTLDAAVELACRLESVESAQSSFQTAKGAVEGHPTVMLVDTGSSVTILHKNIWKKAVKGKKELKQATCPVMAVNGESLPLCGQAEVTLQVGSYSGVHKVLVVRDMTQQCLLVCMLERKWAYFLSCRKLKASGNGQPVAARNAIDKSIGVLLSDTEGLTTGERDLLQTLGDVISVGDGDLGRTSVLRHKIDTGSALPIRQQSRRLPFHQRGVVKDMIDGMLKQGIIEPSEGAWASPIVLARKKDEADELGIVWFMLTCLVYLDDIIIFSQTVDEHLQRLRDVLQRFKDAGLKIKPSKCQLLRKSVLYLGHIEKGVEVDPKKTSCVRSWQVPNDRECLRKFLVITESLFPVLPRSLPPLHSLTEKAKPWQWSQQCNEAFDHLRGADTDASQHGLGAVLSQEGDHVIAYASRVLTKAERQYCAPEKRCWEWCGQFDALDRIFGAAGSLDHNSLQWLRNFKEPQGQVARWLDILAEYDFSVQHRPGLQHSNADALSRLPCKQCGLQTSTPLPGLPDAVKKGGSGDGAALLQEGSVCFLSVEDPKQLQDNNADLRQVILWLQHDDFPPVLPKDGSKCVQTLWSQKDHLVLDHDGGVLYRRWEDVPGKGHLQLVIPRTSIQAACFEGIS
eukprot:Em0025g105a